MSVFQDWIDSLARSRQELDLSTIQLSKNNCKPLKINSLHLLLWSGRNPDDEPEWLSTRISSSFAEP
jgi:hypothetical protein